MKILKNLRYLLAITFLALLVGEVFFSSSKLGGNFLSLLLILPFASFFVLFSHLSRIVDDANLQKFILIGINIGLFIFNGILILILL